MATTKRTGLPEFWSTGIAKLLVGEQPCEFEAWVKGHYRITKLERSADFTQWKLDHTEQLRKASERFTAEGWKVSQEKYFRVTGQTAVLVGKADLLIQKTDCRPTIIDIKGGKPRDSDVAQVLIYMVAFPLAWSAPTMQFAGQVIYPTHTVTVTPQEAAALRPRLFALLKRLALETAPEPVPSEGNCRFCDVSETDCQSRFKEAPAAVLTHEF